MAYIESPLFKACMQVCNYFILISDVKRDNEKTEDEKNFAGVYFMKNFINNTNENFNDQRNKIKRSFFCGL